MQKHIFPVFCLVLPWPIFLRSISTRMNKTIITFASYIFINVRHNKEDSPFSVSWSIRVSWFKTELLLAQSQLLIWANKPCKGNGYSCSPDPSLVHYTEHNTVLLTKKHCYCIHIANDWFYLHHNSCQFHFFCLLIGSANHLHCRENQINPLDFVPYYCQHRTQRNAPFSHMQSLPQARYWLYEHVLLYTDNGGLHFLTMRRVKKQKSKQTVKNRMKHRVLCWTEQWGLDLKLVQEDHNTLKGIF